MKFGPQMLKNGGTPLFSPKNKCVLNDSKCLNGQKHILVTFLKEICWCEENTILPQPQVALCLIIKWFVHIPIKYVKR